MADQWEELKNAIVQTLCYRAVFDYPMTYYQLLTYLIQKKTVKKKIFDKCLNQLVAEKKVVMQRGKYFLPKTKPVNWNYRFTVSKRVLNEFDRVFKTLSLIPWIQLLAVTGTLAASNARGGDDVDIFIVTKRKRVWITRFFVVIILKIIGRYRTKENPGGKICPNILVDEDNMAWPLEKRNLYIAHEIAMMVPIVSKKNCYFCFVSSNPWIFNFFGNLKVCEANNKNRLSRQSHFINLLEKVVENLQKRYMKKKITNETISEGVIHFNKNDNTGRILENYNLLTVSARCSKKT